jgi:hypothetical protein
MPSINTQSNPSRRRAKYFLQAFIAVALVALFISVCFAKFPVYLSDYREITGITPGRQNYVVLDDQLLSNSRHDQGDLRLFAGTAQGIEQELPYELVVEHGDASLSHTDVNILEKKRVAGDTHLIIDMAGVPEYDQIELHLADSAHDFVSDAHIDGLRSPLERVGADLGDSVIFDLSKEGLGSNFTLKFPMTRDAYLRVRLPKLAPEQVLQTTVIDSRIGNPSWTPLAGDLPITQDGPRTVVTWNATDEAPVARVVFTVDPSQTNFWRDVEVQTMEGGAITNRSFHRVHLVRDGKLAQAERLEIDLPGDQWDPFQMIIENGDNPPLKITSAKAFAYERRAYFDPRGNTSLALFYGNPGLIAPSYVYTQPRGEGRDPVATLGPDHQNPERAQMPGSLPFGGGVLGGVAVPGR